MGAAVHQKGALKLGIQEGFLSVPVEESEESVPTGETKFAKFQR